MERQQESALNQARTQAVRELSRQFAAFRGLEGDDERAQWIAEVNDAAFRALFGVHVAFMVRRPDSEVESDELDLALFVPSYLMRFFEGSSVLRHPSVVVEVGPEGTMMTVKNRYGDSREPMVMVDFTTLVPDGR